MFTWRTTVLGTEMKHSYLIILLPYKIWFLLEVFISAWATAKCPHSSLPSNRPLWLAVLLYHCGITVLFSQHWEESKASYYECTMKKAKWDWAWDVGEVFSFQDNESEVKSIKPDKLKLWLRGCVKWIR